MRPLQLLRRVLPHRRQPRAPDAPRREKVDGDELVAVLLEVRLKVVCSQLVGVRLAADAAASLALASPPARRARLIVSLVSWRGGSIIGTRPTNFIGPSPKATATARESSRRLLDGSGEGGGGNTVCLKGERFPRSEER